MKRSNLSLWLMVVALSFAPAVSNGLARFSYALILPAMRQDLDWSYTLAGWINTANALGYLAGALIMFRLNRYVLPTTLFVWGMGITGLSLIAAGFTQDFTLLSLLRFGAGVGGGMAFISGATLVSATWPDQPAKNALAIAVYFGGGGIGILITGLTVPPLLAIKGVSAWPLAWLLIGGVGLGAWLLSWPAAVKSSVAIAEVKGSKSPLPSAKMLPSLIGYFFFSAGYIVYMTFVIAWLKQNSASLLMVMLCWSILGVGVTISGFAWKGVLSRYKNGIPLGASSLVTAIGAGVLLVMTDEIGIILSAVIFGMAFFIAPTSVTAYTRHNLPKAHWGEAIALYTILFASGQTLGPVGAGIIADLTGDLQGGMMAGVVLLVLGGIAGLIQKPLNPKE